MEKLHLDSEYRNRWVEFQLASGKVEDSRLKNWRHIAWNQVICLSAHLVGHVHRIDCGGPNFIAFLNFRWAGQEAIYDKDGKYIGHRSIRIWTIGWTDGRLCFLRDIDFYTGECIKDYSAPLSQFMGHVHPLVMDRILGKVNNGLRKFS